MVLWTHTFDAVIAVWLNASQRSRVGVTINRSTRVKRFEQSNILYVVLYKNVCIERHNAPFIRKMATLEAVKYANSGIEKGD